MIGTLSTKMYNVTITHRDLRTDCYSDMVYATDSMSAKRRAWDRLVKSGYTKNIFLNDYDFLVTMVRDFNQGWTL